MIRIKQHKTRPHVVTATAVAALALALAATLALSAGGGTVAPALATASGPSDACPRPSAPADDATALELRRSVRCLINVERAVRGLGKLKREKPLQKAAQRHSAAMVETGCLAHRCGDEAELASGSSGPATSRRAEAWQFAESTGCGVSAEAMVVELDGDVASTGSTSSTRTFVTSASGSCRSRSTSAATRATRPSRSSSAGARPTPEPAPPGTRPDSRAGPVQAPSGRVDAGSWMALAPRRHRRAAAAWRSCVAWSRPQPAPAVRRRAPAEVGPGALDELRNGQARDAILCLINDERDQRRLPALDRNKKLQKAAQRHNERMDGTGCFSHQCPGEPALDARLDVDYLSGGLTRWGIRRERSPGGCGDRRDAGGDRERLDEQPGAPREHPQPRLREIGVGFSPGTPAVGNADGGIYTTDFGLRVG